MENSIEEDIERLEYIDRTYSYNNYYCVWDLKCIETLLSEYKRLQKENEELRAKWDKDTHILQNELDLTNADKINNYIPVQKVKEKIEELDIEISTCEYADDDSEEYKQEVEKNKAELLMAKKVLQQLLESEENK